MKLNALIENGYGWKYVCVDKIDMICMPNYKYAFQLYVFFISTYIPQTYESFEMDACHWSCSLEQCTKGYLILTCLICFSLFLAFWYPIHNTTTTKDHSSSNQSSVMMDSSCYYLNSKHHAIFYLPTSKITKWTQIAHNHSWHSPSSMT